MSDADRLRRAAAKLRAAAKFPTAFPAGAWRGVQSAAGSMTAVAVCDDHLAGEHDACENCWVIAGHGGTESVAEYVTTMHPPVALAFANLLTCISYMPSASNQTDMVSALEATDAVLREDAS